MILALNNEVAEKKTLVFDEKKDVFKVGNGNYFLVTKGTDRRYYVYHMKP